MTKIGLVPAIMLFTCALQAQDFASIKLKKSVEIIDQNSFAAESVSISDDGKRLCWIAKARDSKILIPGEIFVKDDELVRKVKKGGVFNAFTKCSFDQDNNLVASKLHWRPLALSRTLIMGAIRGDFDPIGYASSISIFDEQDEIIKRLNPKDFGLKNNRIFLKHPRLSPNGEWITFYVKTKKNQGVYLQHLATAKTYKLSDEYDKHPTWSPDGTKILFHYQVDATETTPEKAFLGYFDLATNDQGELLKTQRILLDDPSKIEFRYQKHPAILPGTDLVFFHGEKEAGDKKALFVRKLEVGSKSIELKIELQDGTKITKAKHPASGAYSDQLVFIGKAKGAKEDMVLKLSSAAINQLVSELP